MASIPSVPQHSEGRDTIDNSGTGPEHHEKVTPGAPWVPTPTAGPGPTQSGSVAYGGPAANQPYQGQAHILQAGYPKSVEVQDQASADRGRTGPYPSHVGGGAPAAGSMGYSHRATTGTGTKLFGKVESTLGSMVGSHDLKARGLEKQRDVKLADAERLESQRAAHADLASDKTPGRFY